MPSWLLKKFYMWTNINWWGLLFCLEALCANMDILITGLDVCHVIEWKGNLTDSTVWNTGGTGDMHHVIYKWSLLRLALLVKTCLVYWSSLMPSHQQWCFELCGQNNVILFTQNSREFFEDLLFLFMDELQGLGECALVLKKFVWEHGGIVRWIASPRP